MQRSILTAGRPDDRHSRPIPDLHRPVKMLQSQPSLRSFAASAKPDGRHASGLRLKTAFRYRRTDGPDEAAGSKLENRLTCRYPVHPIADRHMVTKSEEARCSATTDLSKAASRRGLRTLIARHSKLTSGNIDFAFNYGY